MYKICYVLLLLSCVTWLVSHSYAMLVAFALVLRVGYGGIAAMTAAVAAARFCIEGRGELLGFLFTSFGVSCLVGPPLAAVLLDSTQDYKWPVFVASFGAIVALAAAFRLRDAEPNVSPNAEAVTAD